MRPDNPELASLLTDRVIPLRFTSLKGVDLSTFRFDYDLTFVALLLDPISGKTIARWGSRDSESATNRLSMPGLMRMVRAALADYRPGKTTGFPQPPAQTLPEQYPTFAASKRAQEPCYHCHYAHDAQLNQARADGNFTKAMLFRYPLPENIGISLDVDKGNLIRAVRPVSVAAKAGVRVGDVLLRANDTRIYTTADLQWALDPVPSPGKVALTIARGGKPLPPLFLALPAGWRETDISWRPSQGVIPPTLGIWETALTPEEKRALRIGEDRLALRVTFLFAGEKWKAAQGDLKKGDVIVAVGGKNNLPAMNARQFHTYVRLHYNVGDTLPLTVLRDGERREVLVPCVEVTFE